LLNQTSRKLPEDCVDDETNEIEPLAIVSNNVPAYRFEGA
jgi:hypothetical protein